LVLNIYLHDNIRGGSHGNYGFEPCSEHGIYPNPMS
jgi:hypothetical protein